MGLVREGVPGAHQCTQNEGGGTCSNSLPASVSRPERLPDKQRRFHCCLSPASGWHSVSEIVPDGIRHHSWTERHLVRLEAWYIPGKKNVLADQLCWPDRILLIGWSLLPLMFEEIYRVFGRPHLNLFATRANTKLLLYLSPIPDPRAWKQDTSFSVGPSVRLCLPPICAAPSGHLMGSGVGGSIVGSHSSTMASEGVVCGSTASSHGRTTRASEGLEPAGSASRKEVSPRPRDSLT